MLRTFPLVLAVILMVVVPTQRTHGGAKRNAATWYQLAIDELEQFDRADADYVADHADRVAAAPTPRLRRIARQARRIINFAEKGATRTYCDFHLDHSQGMELLMPHLARLRSIGRLMRLKAVIQLHDGKVDAASSTIASMYRMGEHLNDDRILISSLVGNAIYAYADAATQLMIDRGQMTPSASGRLLDAMARFDDRDPFAYAAAVGGEQELVVDWMHARLEATGDSEFAREMAGLAGASEQGEVLAAMAPEELMDHVYQYEDALDAVTEVFTLEYEDTERLAEITEAVMAGEHGEVAKIMCPSFTFVYNRLIEVRKELAERKALLGEFAAGEADAVAQAGAMYIYLRAIDMFYQSKSVDQVRRFDADPPPVIDIELEESMVALLPIIDVIRQASLKRRCAFEPVRLPGLVAPVQFYVPGFRDLYRVLLGDAVRMIRAGDRKAAVDRIEIALRMTAHLASDGTMGSALVAHTGFKRAQDQLHALVTASALTSDEKDALYVAFQRIGRNDPFGYIAGLTDSRARLGWQLQALKSADVVDDAIFESAQKKLGQWDGDRLMHILVAVGRPSGTDDPARASPPEAMLSLVDILASSGLEQARSQKSLIEQLQKQWAFDQLTEHPVVSIADYAEHRVAARAALRAANQQLRPVVDAVVDDTKSTEPEVRSLPQ